MSCSRPRAALLASATLALGLVLAACSSDTPTVVESASAAPSPTSSAASTPTPTSTPTLVFDAADPATWLITTSAIGPARLGAVEEEDIAGVFEPVFVRTDVCEGLTLYAASDPQLGITAFTGVSGYESVEHPGWLRTAGISAPDAALDGTVPGTPLTAEGIGLGSTLAQATAAYPTLTPWVDPRGSGYAATTGFTEFAAASGYSEYVFTDGGGSLIFTVRDDHVVSIVAAFDLPPFGFCS